MTLFTPATRLTDAAMRHPQVIPVASRMGVGLGNGVASVDEICRAKGVDTDFFLTIVNTFVNPDYFPKCPESHMGLKATVDYLSKTARDYLENQLPNIERHFRSLCARSGADNNLGLLLGFFDGLKGLMTAALEKDLNEVFPGLKAGECRSEWTDFTAQENIAAQLHDLLFFFVAHLRGSYDRNLALAVVTAVFSLERDYMQNHRIRVRVLLPAMQSTLEGSGA